MLFDFLKLWYIFSISLYSTLPKIHFRLQIFSLSLKCSQLTQIFIVNKFIKGLIWRVNAFLLEYVTLCTQFFLKFFSLLHQVNSKLWIYHINSFVKTWGWNKRIYPDNLNIDGLAIGVLPNYFSQVRWGIFLLIQRTYLKAIFLCSIKREWSFKLCCNH